MKSAPAWSRCIPLEKGDGDSPVIKARVNGQGPFAFVLDTGASGTTLDSARIARLNLTPDLKTERAQGMGGAIEVRLYRLARLQAGAVDVRNITVPGLSAPSFRSHDIAGLAGINLFGRAMAVWRWDQACVQIAPSGAAPTGSGWVAASSRWLQPWKVMLPVTIGGVSGWGLLDTGAQTTVLSPGFARLLALGAAIDTDTKAEITGIDGQASALTRHRIPAATVGAWRFEQVELATGALPLFDRLGGLDEPLAVIGMDWIGTKPFAIDYGRRTVWQQSSVSERRPEAGGE